MMRRPLLLCLALGLAGCPRHEHDGDDSDAAPVADAASSADGRADATPTAAGWQAVEDLLTARAAAAGATRLGLVVWDQHDQKVYEHMIGDLTPDTRLAIASASKLVSGLVIFDVIRQGKLSLDSTTGQVLGWTGPNAAITLRHLLSFTSGLPRQVLCTANPLVTLARCVDDIAQSTPTAPLGTRFDYGSSHLQVAARMAEVTTGKTWNELFADTLRAPLGLPPEVAYYTVPRQSIGMINPLIAAGMRASMDEYASFLALAFHEGAYRGLTIGTPALFADQAKEPFPMVTIGYSPWPAYRYGLASWLVCDTPATGCTTLSSPGAFGFTPWYDREAGYYAILGMEMADPGDTEGVVQFAVDLSLALQPLIRARFGH